MGRKTRRPNEAVTKNELRPPVTKVILRRAVENAWNHYMLGRRAANVYPALYAAPFFEQLLCDVELGPSTGPVDRKPLTLAELKPSAKKARPRDFYAPSLNGARKDVISALNQREHIEVVEDAELTFRFKLKRKNPPQEKNALYVIDFSYGVFEESREVRTTGTCDTVVRPLRSARPTTDIGPPGFPEPSEIMVQVSLRDDSHAQDDHRIKKNVQNAAHHFAAMAGASEQGNSKLQCKLEHVEIESATENAETTICATTRCTIQGLSLSIFRTVLVDELHPISAFSISWSPGEIGADQVRKMSEGARRLSSIHVHSGSLTCVWLNPDTQLSFDETDQSLLVVVISKNPEALRFAMWEHDLVELFQKWTAAGAD